ncbi:MAG: hypothetical protein ABIK09_10295 [Pseudomonadota bacterium]
MREKWAGVGMGLVMALWVAASPSLARPNQGDAATLLNHAESDVKIEERLKQFAPAPIGVEPGRLTPRDLKLIGKLVEAADWIDRVFWDQVSDVGRGWYEVLLEAGGERAQRLARLMEIHYGPWDRLRDNQEFIGTRSRPQGAGFYPSDASRRELDGYLELHPEHIGTLMGPYSVIRRQGDGFVSIPYGEKFRTELSRAATALREAAGYAKDDALEEFLVARADALLSGEYLESEMAWMETAASPLIVVFGPYEFYEDHLWGVKASFEAIIALRDDKETLRFAALASRMEDLVAALPISEACRARLSTRKQAPVTIADEIYAAGETRAGAQTSAFSLPNDLRVRQKKGSRQVILRNVARAKFNHSWVPLSHHVVAEEQLVHLDFNSYYHLLIAVQLAHGIAPVIGADEVDPRTKLRQRRQIIEEARSDALGLAILLQLADGAVLEGLTPTRAAVTWLTAAFRVVRLDPGGAHGVAKAITYNFLAAEGVFVYDPTTRRYRVKVDALKPAVAKLCETLVKMTLDGDYAGAGALIMEYGLLSGDVQAKLSELGDVPVDIVPEYSIKRMLK